MFEVEFSDSVLFHKDDDYETPVLVKASGDLNEYGDVTNLHIEELIVEDTEETINPKSLSFKDMKRLIEQAEQEIIELAGRTNYDSPDNW